MTFEHFYLFPPINLRTNVKNDITALRFVSAPEATRNFAQLFEDNDADIDNLEKILTQYGYQKNVEKEQEILSPVADDTDTAPTCEDSVPLQTIKDGSPLIIGFEANESTTPKYACAYFWWFIIFFKVFLQNDHISLEDIQFSEATMALLTRADDSFEYGGWLLDRSSLRFAMWQDQILECIPICADIPMYHLHL